MPIHDERRDFTEYTIGERLTGNVVQLTRFGAFVELPNGDLGIIELPQLTNDKTLSPSDILSVGDEVNAQVIGFGKKEQQIALSLIGIEMR